MAEALTLAATLFTVLMYPSPFDFALPVTCDADAEAS